MKPPYAGIVGAAAGCLWGLEELLLGRGCAAAGQVNLTGSLLTGTTFFFLSAAYAFHPSRRGLLPVFALAAMLKLLAAPLRGVSPLHGSVLNPVCAYALETAAWILAATSAGSARLTRPLPLLAAGAAAAALAALAFPATGLLTGTPVCRAASGLPVSLQYLPLAALVAAPAAWLGQRTGLWARQRAEASAPAGFAFARGATVAAAAAAILVIGLQV